MSEPLDQDWLVSSSPHAHSGESVRRIMLDVILALVPATAASVLFFGLNAARLVAVCVATCVALEYAARRIMKRDGAVGDLSAVVTGVLLALNLPSSLPTGMAVLGSAAAIVVAKQLYGGLGYNLFNPALIGRTVLLLSFPVAMTTWPAPLQGFGTDAVTMATPLGEWKTAWSAGAAPEEFFETFSLAGLVLGRRPGCLGETSAVALLLGGAYLLYRRGITWHTPVAFIGTVAVFSGAVRAFEPARTLSPLYHVLTGGLLLGAIFMATDMVTTPVTGRGRIVFGVGCGVLTFLIRQWGGYPEGVSFSILIMNAVTPLINRATRPRVFGHGPAARGGPA